MALVLSLPVDICLSIFRYLSIQDVLNIRQVLRRSSCLDDNILTPLSFDFQTCKTFLGLTKLRSVWHLLLTTNIQQQNIPVPRLSRQPIESLTASELEEITLQALRLRHNWTSLSPIASSQITIACDVLPIPTRFGVVALQFLPGRANRYLLSLALTSNVGRLFSLQCWDLNINPPTSIAMRTVQQCGWFVVNTDETSSDVVAIQSPEYVVWHLFTGGPYLFRTQHRDPLY